MRLMKQTDGFNDEEIMLMAQISDALAHPARIKIFRYVMRCNMKCDKVCNGDIVAEFDLAQATISQHVKKLVQSGLLEAKKDYKYTYYYANLGTLQRYRNIVKNFN